MASENIKRNKTYSVGLLSDQNKRFTPQVVCVVYRQGQTFKDVKRRGSPFGIVAGNSPCTVEILSPPVSRKVFSTTVFYRVTARLSSTGLYSILEFRFSRTTRTSENS